MEKKGVPKEILEELDIGKKIEKSDVHEVTVFVEAYQAKIPIPKGIRVRLKLKHNTKCKLYFDEEKKEIICKF